MLREGCQQAIPLPLRSALIGLPKPVATIPIQCTESSTYMSFMWLLSSTIAVADPDFRRRKLGESMQSTSHPSTTHNANFARISILATGKVEDGGDPLLLKLHDYWTSSFLLSESHLPSRNRKILHTTWNSRCNG